MIFGIQTKQNRAKQKNRRNQFVQTWRPRWILSGQVVSVRWGTSCAVSTWDAFYSLLHPLEPSTEPSGTLGQVCDLYWAPHKVLRDQTHSELQATGACILYQDFLYQGPRPLSYVTFKLSISSNIPTDSSSPSFAVLKATPFLWVSLPHSRSSCRSHSYAFVCTFPSKCESSKSPKNISSQTV